MSTPPGTYIDAALQSLGQNGAPSFESWWDWDPEAVVTKVPHLITSGQYWRFPLGGGGVVRGSRYAGILVDQSPTEDKGVAGVLGVNLFYLSRLPLKKEDPFEDYIFPQQLIATADSAGKWSVIEAAVPTHARRVTEYFFSKPPRLPLYGRWVPANTTLYLSGGAWPTPGEEAVASCACKLWRGIIYERTTLYVTVPSFAGTTP